MIKSVLHPDRPFFKSIVWVALAVLSPVFSSFSQNPPRAHHLYVSGTTAGANPATYSALKAGLTIKVWYTYADINGHPESGTTYQWYRADDRFGTNKTAIGVTTQTLSIGNGNVGKYISVVVTPRDATDGFGTPVEFKTYSATFDNPVLANASSCSKAGGGVVGPGNFLDTTTPICAPRNTTWDITYTGIDYNSGNTPVVLVDWGDTGASATFQSYTPTFINNLLTLNDTLSLTKMANQVWKASPTHTYSFPGSQAATTANAVCTYTLRTGWGRGTNQCLTNLQTQPFTVWDKEDNTLLGTIDVNHKPGTGGTESGEVTNICRGDQTAIRVQDASDFNCTNPLETILTNTEARWVQWVYGSSSNITTGPGASEKIVINGISYSSSDLPVYGKVTYQAANTSAPLPSETDDIIMPTSANAGETFVITMRSWNTCNKMDENIGDGGLNPLQAAPFNVFDMTHTTAGVGSTMADLYTQLSLAPGAAYANSTPVTRTYTIQIISKPATPTYSPAYFCEQVSGTPANSGYDITVSGVAGTYNFYLTNLATLLRTDNTAPYTFNPVTDPAVAANRIDPLPPPANPSVYNRYVTVTTANGCTSDPLEIVINISAVKTGGTIANAAGSSPTNICTGTDPAAFTVSVASGGGDGIAGNEVYQWQQSPDGSAWSDIATATSATYDPPALTATTYYRRRVRESYYNITGTCDEAFSNTYQFIVDTPVTAGAINGAEIICLTANPSIMGNQTTPTGGNGTYNYQWEESTDNVVFNTIAGATSATYDPGGAGVLSQTMYYRRRVTSGACTTDGADANTDPDNIAYTTSVAKTVNQLVVAGSIGNAQVICSGDNPGVLTEVTPPSGGNGTTYTFEWQESNTGGGSGFGPATGTITNATYDPPVLTSTKYYRRKVTSGVCAATFSNEIAVIVNPLPTASGPTGGGAVCGGSPAPDIVWTLTGTAPFNVTYTDGTSTFGPIVENTTTFTIAGPTTAGTYQITALSDANGCVGTTFGSTASVIIGGFPPLFDSGPTLSISSACDDGASTANPNLVFSLDNNSASLANFTLRYRIDGGAIRTKTFDTDAAGNSTSTISFSDTELDNTAPSPHTIRIVSIIAASGCQTTFNTDLNFTVNPRPAAPTSSGNLLVCSDAITSASISATVAGGVTIDWYDVSTGGSVLTGGTNVTTFNPAAGDEPAAGAAKTYYAEARNSTTNCTSTARTAITITNDAKPSAPAAMANAQTCITSHPITATAADNGGTGYWSTANTVYYENFDNLADGTTVDNGVFGWIRSIAGITLLAGDYFEVRSGRFTSEDLENGTVTAFWRSAVVDVSALTTIDITADLQKDGDLETTDFIEIYYVLDGTPTKFGGITRVVDDGPTSVVNSTATATAINVSANSTLQIEVRIRSNSDLEIQSFDNVIVRTSGSSPVTFDNIFNANTTVRNLQDGANAIQWNVVSALGACILAPDPVTITKIAQPVAVASTASFCEESAGSNNKLNVDITQYDDDVANFVAGRSVTWFTDAGRTAAVATPASVTITDGLTLYAIVTETVSGSSCTNTTGGQMTFTIFDRPTVTNQTAEYCEDVLNSNQHSGVNLNSFNASIHPTGTITWFETYNPVGEVFGSPVATPASYTVTDGQTLFARVVDGNSCVNKAELAITVHPLPSANNIIGPSTVYAATVTVCKSNAFVLFQIDPDLNDTPAPGGTNPTYQWTVPTGLGQFQLFGGGGATDFFVLLKFPNAVPSPGLTLSVKETTSEGCSQIVNSINIIVEDSPSAPVITGSTDVCADQQSVSYMVASPTATSTYNWTVPGAMGSIVAGQGTGTITLNIGPDVDGSTTFFTPYQISVLEQSASGCNSVTPDTHDIDVHDKPTIAPLTTLTICNGSAPNESIVMSVPGSTFTWEVLSISSSLTGTNTGVTGTGDIAHVLTNSSNLEGSVTYRITAFGPDIDPGVGTSFCQGQQTTLTVKVEPTPVVVPVNNAPRICNGGTPNISVTSPTVPTVPANLRFDVVVSLPLGVTGTGTAANNQTNIAAPFTINSGTLTNSTDVAKTVQYTITPKLAGCSDGAPQIVNVVVDPTPSAALVNGDALICSGGNVNIDITSPTVPNTASNLTFDVGVSSTNNGATGGTAFVALTGQSFPLTLNGTLTNSSSSVLTVTFTITPKLNGCTNGTPQTTQVQVEPTPQAAINNTTATVCNAGNVGIQITSTTTPTVPGDLTFDLVVTSDNPGATGGTAFANVSGQSFPLTINGTLTNSSNSFVTVTYTVTPKLAGCANGPNQVTTVKVEPTPAAAIVNTTAKVCNGGNTNITISSPTGPTIPGNLTFDVAVSSTNLGVTGGTAFAALTAQSFPLSITGTLTNSSNSFVTVTYTVTPKLNGCLAGTAVTTTVDVEPTPQAAVSNLISTVCNGGNTNISITSPSAPSVPANLTFDVAISSTNNAVTGGTAFAALTGQSFPLSINGTLTNSGTSFVTVTYTITPKLNGCVNGPIQTTTVKVEPTPQASITNTTATVCNNGNVNIAIASTTGASVPANLTFDLAVTSDNVAQTSGTAFSNLVGQSFPLSITGTLINSSDNFITVTYTVTPMIAGCAVGPVQTTTVRVEPTPKAVISNTTGTVCNGGSVNIAITSPTGPTIPGNLTFDVAVSSTNAAVTGGTSFLNLSNQTFPLTINGTLTNSSNSFVTVTYSITPKLNGCTSGPVQTTTVKVEPTPQAAITNTTAVICTGDNVNIQFTTSTSVSVPANLTYDIAVTSSNMGATGGTAMGSLVGQTLPLTISGTLTNSSNSFITVTYTITPKLNGCVDGPSQVTTVKVEPTPVASVSNTTPVICNGGNVNVQITSPTIANTPANLSFDVAVSSTNPGATGGSAFASLSNQPFPVTIGGTLTNSSNSFITVTYTVTPELNGCANGSSVFTTVIVEPTPLAVVSNMDPVICNAGSPNISVTSPTVANTPANLTFDVAVSLPSGVAGTGVAGSGLTGVSAPFDINTGTLTNSTNVAKTVTYTITPKLSGCANGTAQVVTVIVEPTPQASFSNNLPKICDGGTPNITITSSTTPNTLSDLTFDVTVSLPGGVTGTLVAGNGIVGATAPFSINTGILTNTNNSFQTITYTITPKLAGCANGPTQTVDVILEPTPQANVPVNNTPVVCNGGTPSIDISSPSTPSVMGNLTFDVSVALPAGVSGTGVAGSGITGATAPFSINAGTLTNSNSTARTVVYTITPKLNGCANGPTKTVNVIVEPTPQAAINNTTAVVCNGGAVNLQITSPTSPNTPGNLTFDVAVASTNNGATGGTAFTSLTGQAFPLTINGTLTNSSNSFITVTYTITPKLAGCADGPAQVTTVKVEPTPVAAVSNTTPVICTGSSTSIAITSPTVANTPSNLRFDVAVSSDNAGATGGTAFTALNNQPFPFTLGGTLTNSSNSFITVTYTITPELNGCASGTPVVTTVIVEPTPKAVAVNNDPVLCNGGTPDISITSPTSPNTPGNLTFDVAVSLPAGVTGSGIAGAGLAGATAPFSINAGTLTNSTNVAKTVTYTITPKLSGCSNGPAQVVNVIVEPTPQASFTNNLPKICDGGTPNITITSTTTPNTPSDLTFDVSVSLPAGVTGTLTAGNGVTGATAPFSINTGVLTNTNNSFQTVTYTITPKLAGCANGPTQTVDVIVEPTPQANVPVNNLPVVCNGGTPSIDITSPSTPSVIGNLTFDVAVSLPSGVSGTGVAGSGITGATAPFSINSGTLSNSTNAFKTVTYTITPKLNGCANGPTKTVTVNVEPIPTAVIVNNLPTICSEGTPNISVTSPTTPTNLANLTFDVVVTLPAGVTGTGVAANGIIGAVAPFSINAGTLVHDNISSTPLTVTYTITPKLSGCSDGPVQVISVIVRPDPVGVFDNSTLANVCSDEAFSYNIQTVNIDGLGNGVSSTFTFTVSSSNEADVPTPSGLDRSVASSAVISGNFHNVTSNDVIITYSITPFSSSGTCQGLPFDVEVTIHPEPTSPPLTSVEICSDEVNNFNLQTLVINNTVGGGNSVPSNFKYTVVSSHPVDVFPGSNRTSATPANITDVYTNKSNHDVTITYTVTPVSQTGTCEGTPFDFKITVHPEPVGINVIDPVCSSSLNHNIQTSHIDAAGGNGLASIFSYTVASTNEAAVPTPPALDRVTPDNLPITDTFLNTSGLPVDVIYTITPFNAANPTCGGTPFTFTVRISPKPVGFDFDAAPICSNVPFDIDPQDIIDDTGNGGNGVVSTFTWTANYGTPGNLTVNGATPPATDTDLDGHVDGFLTNKTSVQRLAIYTITPTSGSCVGNTFEIRVPIDPQPVLDPTVINTPICSDTPFDFDLAATAGTVAHSSYNVSLQSVHPDLTPDPTNRFFIPPLGLPGPNSRTGEGPTTIRNERYTNKTRTIGLFVEYSISAKSEFTPGLVCQGDNLLVQMEILPEPVMDPQIANPIACSDAASNILFETDGISIGATSFFVNSAELNGTNIGLPNAAVGNVIASSTNRTINPASQVAKDFVKSDKFNLKVNDAIGDRVIIYNVTPRSGAGCLGDPFDINLEIRPEPVIQAVTPAPACSDEAFNISVAKTAPSVGIAQYSVTSIDWDKLPAPGLIKGPSNINVGLQPPSATLLINDTYTNTTEQVLKAYYVIVPISADNCSGDPDNSVIVDVSPVPTVASGLDKIVCSEADASIVITDTRTATGIGFPAQSFEIVRGGAGALSTINAPALSAFYNGTTVNAIQSDAYANATNNPIDVTYSVVAWTGPGLTGCASPQKNIILKVEPEVKATFTDASAAAFCSGLTTDILLTSPTQTTPNNFITFDVTFTGSVLGASPQFNKTEGSKIEQTLNNTSNENVIITYSIKPKASGAASGVGCEGQPVLVPITVLPRPKLNTIVNKVICEDTEVNLTLTSPTYQSTSPGSIFFNYNSDDLTGDVTGETDGTKNNNLTTPEKITDILVNNVPENRVVSYTVTPGFGTCVGDPVTVNVTVAPRPVITPLTNFEICSGSVFDPVSIGVDTDASTTLINWSVPANADLSGESNGAGNLFTQVLFNNSDDKRTLTYTFVATNAANSPTCAGSPVTLDVTVYPVPQITGLPFSKNVCFDETVSIPLTSTKLNTEYTWAVDNSGNANLPVIPSGGASGASASITQKFTNTGTDLGNYQYTITPFVVVPSTSEQCFGTDKTLVVNVAPQIIGQLYSSDGDATAYVCKGSKDFMFFDFGGLPLFEYTYTNGTETKVVSKKGPIDIVTVQPEVTTTYTLLKVKDGFGCVSEPVGQSVTVNVGVTNAAFAVVGPEVACSPYQVQFQHEQVAGVGYTWKWFDGIADSSYVAAVNQAGQIVRHTFFNPSPNGIVKYKVYLEASLDSNYPGGCLKTTFKEVKVYPTPAPAVFADKTVICSDEPVTFVNSSQGISQQRWFYRVLGTTAEIDLKSTPTVVYNLSNTTTSNPIVLEVVYQSTNGNCVAPDIITPITVYRGVDAAFSNTEPTTFVGGHSYVTFNNTSQPVDETDFRYEWDFGLDANPATANTSGPFDLDYTTPGPKEISLLATNKVAEAAGLSCTNEFKASIQIVVPPLIADFVAIPLEACFPTDVTVVENLATGDVFEWRVYDDLGKIAATSNANLPVFQIPNPGKYTIELTTKNSFTGDQKTDLQEVVIYSLPVASFDLRPNVVYVPDTELNTFNFSSGATEYEWDFGDGSVVFEEEPKYKYKIEGVYDILLIAKNDHGNGVVCVDSLSRKIVAKQGGVTRVPNAFTPNPNGPSGGRPGNNSFNDVFLPQVKGAEEFNMQIFDRWGNLIFESNDSSMGWDGYDRNGRILPAGVYVYKLTLRLSDGQRTTQLGDITMIR